MRILKELFSDSLGDVSSMRVIVYIVVIVVLFNWTYVNITTGQINDLGLNETGSILGALGMKAIQKYIEMKELQ